jgi:hypothetical protein
MEHEAGQDVYCAGWLWTSGHGKIDAGATAGAPPESCLSFVELRLKCFRAGLTVIEHPSYEITLRR